MSHASVLEFARASLPSLTGKTVLEVGAYDINGSIRPYVESQKPLKYVGVDIEPGPMVDKVVPANQLVKTFGEDSFDVVICQEMLEHADDWRTAIENMKQVTNDYLLITTRSEGFPYHGFPSDCWRYSLEDMKQIFADFDIITLESDPEYPGVMMLARKTKRPPVDLDLIELTPAPPKPHWH